MSDLKLKLILDPADSRLHQKAKRVKNPHSDETRSIVEGMKALQRKFNIIGLSAPQVGINRRIITAYHEGLDEIIEFINPRIAPESLNDANIYWSNEGCESHAGIYAEVARYRSLSVMAFQLKYPKEVKLQASGTIARIIQHEINHLDGLLITDLGHFVRNIMIDVSGQKKLFEATAKSLEEGQKDWELD